MICLTSNRDVSATVQSLFCNSMAYACHYGMPTIMEALVTQNGKHVTKCDIFHNCSAATGGVHINN